MVLAFPFDEVETGAQMRAEVVLADADEGHQRHVLLDQFEGAGAQPVDAVLADSGADQQDLYTPAVTWTYSEGLMLTLGSESSGALTVSK